MKTANKSNTEIRTDGAVHQVKGITKDAAKNLSEYPGLRINGIIKKIAGKIRKKIGR